MIEIIGMAARDRNSSSSPSRRIEQDAPRTWERGATFSLALLLLAAPLACKKDEAPASAPPAPAPAPPPPAPAASTPAEKPSPDVKAVLAWLDALRERDPGALLEKSALPFDFRDADAHKKKCGSRQAATKAAAQDVAKCLAMDPLFHAEMSATLEPRLVALDAGSLPPWAQAWGKTMRPGLRPCSTFVHGERDARELVLLVGDDGVHGLWQQLTIEPK